MFAPASWNLAETSRCIQIAKALKNHYNIIFASFGGQFEEFILKENFVIEKLAPQLTPEKIEYIYKVDQGEKLGEMFSAEEIKARARSQVEMIKKYEPAAIITGFELTTNISARLTNTTLIWLTQSTWDLPQMIRLGLGNYTDDFDLPIFRFLPSSIKRWLSVKMLEFYGAHILKPYNKAAEGFGIEKFKRMESLWQGTYNLLPEPDDFSGNTEIPSTYHYIGPLLADMNTPVPDSVKNIPKDKPVIYFAMGSSGRFKVIRNIVEGFENQPFRVIAPIKKKIAGKQVRVPENVIVTDWLPALEVSKTVDLSVIHGGVGTVMTAALAGKSVIGVGMMYEQEYNIECLVRKGFAKRISRNRLTPKLLNKTIISLLNDEKYAAKAIEYQKVIQRWHDPELIRKFFLEHI